MTQPAEPTLILARQFVGSTAKCQNYKALLNSNLRYYKEKQKGNRTKSIDHKVCDIQIYSARKLIQNSYLESCSQRKADVTIRQNFNTINSFRQQYSRR